LGQFSPMNLLGTTRGGEHSKVGRKTYLRKISEVGHWIRVGERGKKTLARRLDLRRWLKGIILSGTPGEGEFGTMAGKYSLRIGGGAEKT